VVRTAKNRSNIATNADRVPKNGITTADNTATKSANRIEGAKNMDKKTKNSPGRGE